MYKKICENCNIKNIDWKNHDLVLITNGKQKMMASKSLCIVSSVVHIYQMDFIHRSFSIFAFFFFEMSFVRLYANSSFHQVSMAQVQYFY